MTAEWVSLLVGLVGGIIGLVSFFAAVIFYVHGSRVNRLTEQILANIDAKTTMIHGQYGRIVDRTFDLAQGGSEALVSALSKEMTSLARSLKESTAEAIRATEASREFGQTYPLEDLEARVGAIIDKRVAAVQQEAVRIIEISGYRAAYDGIVRLVLRSLQHGPVAVSAIQRYMHSHCFDLLERDLAVLLTRLNDEGLIVPALELNRQIEESKHISVDLFWSLTPAGKRELAASDGQEQANNRIQPTAH